MPVEQSVTALYVFTCDRCGASEEAPETPPRWETGTVTLGPGSFAFLLCPACVPVAGIAEMAVAPQDRTPDAAAATKAKA